MGDILRSYYARLLIDRYNLFVKNRDLNVIYGIVVSAISKLEPERIIYCGKNFYVKWLVRKVERRYGIVFAPRTRFLAVKEQYIDRQYSAIPSFVPKEGDVVVDVGAETGDYTLFCSKCCKCSKVYSFEPVVINFKTLDENLKLNYCNNVIAFCVGLSSENSFQNANYNGDTIAWDEERKNFMVYVRTLDSYDISSLDILKIDVEGNEVEVIKGALNTIQRLKPRIILETHSRILRERSLRLLSQVGYEVAHEGRSFYAKDGNEIKNLFLSFRAITK